MGWIDVGWWGSNVNAKFSVARATTKLLEGKYTKNDDYIGWILYVQKEEDQRIKEFINKLLEPISHLFPIHVEGEMEQAKGKEKLT